MKTTLNLIFRVLFFSCSSSEIEKSVIDNFVDEQFLKDKNIKVVIEKYAGSNPFIFPDVVPYFCKY